MDQPRDENSDVADEALGQYLSGEGVPVREAFGEEEELRIQEEFHRIEAYRRLEEFYRAMLALTPRVWVTPAIIAINVAVFLAMVASGVHYMSPDRQDLIQWGANYGPLTLDGQLWRLLTSMFLHIGVIHLAFNMYILWGVGRFVERLTGNTGFLILYFASGLAGSLARVWWDATVASAGASGAVFGVFGGLLGFLLPHRKAIPLPALYKNVATFLICNLVFGLMIPGIDMVAHGGGFLGGLLCGLGLSQLLTPAAAKGRRVRNLVVAVVAVAVLVPAAMTLPEAPADYLGQHDRLLTAKRELGKVFNDALKGCQTGKLSEDGLADVIHDEVLPKWRRETAAFAGLKDVPERHTREWKVWNEHAEALLQAWDLLVQGIREDDPAKRARSEEQFKRAKQVLQQLEAR